MYSKNISFPVAEEEVIKFWQETQAFEKSKAESKDRPKFVTLDGPPFATGLPHYGHILAGAIKDTICRFWFQHGFRVDRRFGWDCHGLPVEYEIDKKLGITDRRQVLEMGIDKYNGECKSIVQKYTSEWESTVIRMGRWIDFKTGYKTMDLSFMETTWFMFKKLWERNFVYRGYRIMPYSTACKTPLSNFEASQNYKDVSDPSILIAFPLKKPLSNGMMVELVAWTTTPWTLPANCGLCVNEGLKYTIFEHKGRKLVVQENRVDIYFKDAVVLDSVMGSELVGHDYEQPFDYFESYRQKGFFKVMSDSFVSDSQGTSVVHNAPAFGEQDFESFIKAGLIDHTYDVPCPYDDNGKFTLEPYVGILFKDLDKTIIKDLGSKILMNAREVHSYPFCWRSDTPLMYRLIPNWYIKVSESRDLLTRQNEEINWIPETIKKGRFHCWLAQARDWSISRNRFWGTPLPIWTTDDYSSMICVGSVEELEKLSGRKVGDLHREFIDDIEIVKDGKVYKRVEEVFDCWFESGSVPYGQEHWPFENIEDKMSAMNTSSDKVLVKKDVPADFIAEGLDQTRGWFYTLHVLSSLLFGRPAFKNVVVNGIILAEDGKKMSKRLKNYPDPAKIFGAYGADALRMYLISSPVVVAEDINFKEAGVKEVVKTVLIPWYNSLSFLMDCASGDTKTEMDDWIRASFNNFAVGVEETMKAYQLNNVMGHALSFIDDLSNWYIRINRKQLRLGGNLLSRLLRDFSVVMAPFTPFFSEYCYQSIAKGTSVHLNMYPHCRSSSHSFDKVKKLIEGVRQMREALALKLKRPLKHATFVCNESLQKIFTEYSGIILSECNVLDVAFKSESEYTFTVCVKPFFESLKKNPETMRRKLAVINHLNKEQTSQLLKEDLVVGDVTIKTTDVLIQRQIVGVPNAETFGEFSIILDITQSKEVLEKAAARELYSFVQKCRKELGLVPTDTVNVSLDNKELCRLVKEQYDDIAFGESGELLGEYAYEHDGKNYNLKLYKLN